MIGQNKLRDQILTEIKNDSFPRFSILVGPTGSGKKSLANFIGNELSDLVITAQDVKIGTLKELIIESYTLVSKTVYIIPDADDMSIQAKNSLLKVLEEPANYAYWIMTVNNLSNVLPTIISRGTIYNMEPYTWEELDKFATDLGVSDDRLDIILDICDNPGDIKYLSQIDIRSFYDYVRLVIENIAEVSGANAFKIANKVSLKKDGEGYDLKLFWKMFKVICMRRILNNLSDQDIEKYSPAISITSECLNELAISGINRSSLFDAWILAIRREWM